MIYLFNSGKRDKYRSNILNTLMLPDGAVNEYRYAAFGHRTNVDSTTAQEMLSAGRGTSVAIIFVDRYSGEYQYAPLRLGKLVSCERRGDRLFFAVQLGFRVWPRTLETFSTRFGRDLGGQGIPRLTDADPNRMDDGNYAVIGESIFFEEGLYLWRDDAWDPSVKYLSQVEALRDREHEHVLFVKLAVLNASTRKPVETEIDEAGVARFPLRWGKQLLLSVGYRFPAQDRDPPGRARIELKPSRDAQILTKDSIRVDSTANYEIVPVAGRRFSDTEKASITFDFPAAGGSTNAVISADSAVHFTVRRPKSFWPVTIFAILLYATGSVLVGIQLPEGGGLSLRALLGSIIGLNLIGALMHAGVLFLIALWFGKKIL